MIYEIINPSDPYTLETDCFEAACVACVLLGDGQYSLRTEDDGDELKIPFFMFRTEEAIERYWQKTFGHTPEESGKQYVSEIIAALESVTYGKFSDKKWYLRTLDLITEPENREAFKAEWQDRHGSTNDIGGFAKRLAASLREELANRQAALLG